MNSLNRYFLPAAEWGAGGLMLQGDEAHHCVRVLREQVGDHLIVFDGVGSAVECRIVTASKSQVGLEVVGELQKQSRGLRLDLWQAVPKAGNMELIVQKAVELGVSSIQPLETTNTLVKVDEKKRLKWQRIALEACKQCGQNWLPEVKPSCRLTDALEERSDEGIAIVAALDPRSRPMTDVLSQAPGQNVAALLVGPEGDLTEAEYDIAIEAGFQPVSLGNIVLRVETASLYCLSVLNYVFGYSSSD